MEEHGLFLISFSIAQQIADWRRKAFKHNPHTGAGGHEGPKGKKQLVHGGMYTDYTD
jgi:hypothetical protein